MMGSFVALGFDSQCTAGFIQVVPDAYSVDSLKKMHGVQTLNQVTAFVLPSISKPRLFFGNIIWQPQYGSSVPT